MARPQSLQLREHDSFVHTLLGAEDLTGLALVLQAHLRSRGL